MDPGEILLTFLDQAAQNRNIPYEQRDGALYVATAFRAHRNTSRLILQLDALLRGERVIEIRPQIQAVVRNNAFTWCDKTVVERYGNYLHEAIIDFNIVPSVADFEGHPIKLIDILAQGIENSLDDAETTKIHQDLTAIDRMANNHLFQLAGRYGYHYIFRVGLVQYFLT